jgi:hypothetical protein
MMLHTLSHYAMCVRVSFKGAYTLGRSQDPPCVCSWRGLWRDVRQLGAVLVCPCLSARRRLSDSSRVCCRPSIRRLYVLPALVGTVLALGATPPYIMCRAPLAHHSRRSLARGVGDSRQAVEARELDMVPGCLVLRITDAQVPSSARRDSNVTSG